MKTIYRKWIGERLKYYRALMKLSQSQLAEKINKKKRAYGKYEDGEAEPSIYTLKALCAIFKVTIDEFMQGSPQDNAHPTTEAIG